MKRRFHTLDVFTDTPLAGNPLAVVHDSAGLDTAAMQAIAQEFNLSETVFVLPPDDPVNTARLRIFTPGSELPFAGHPTVGTGILLAMLRAPDQVGAAGLVVALEETIGVIKVEVTRPQGKAARGLFSIPKLPEFPALPARDTALIAEALGLSLSDIGFEGHAPCNISAGAPYTAVPVASLEALDRAQSVPTPAFETAFGGTSHPCAYLYARTGPNSWQTRMFAPLIGITEDPATGSAAAAFAGIIMAQDRLSNGVHQHILAQGIEMGRPSQIVLTLHVHGGVLEEVTIGGAAVIISEGTIDL